MEQILHEYTLTLLRSHTKRHAGQIVLLLVISLAAYGVGFGRQVRAQSDTGPWTTPVNISRSGAASQPVIAAAPDGRLHALWWDSAEGEQYAQTTSLTGTIWTTPTTVSQIFGERKIGTNPDTGKSMLTLKPPLEVQLLSNMHGNVHAFWRDAASQLFDSQVQGMAWTNAVMLADSALTMDAVADEKGRLHLAYLRPENSLGNPSGVYYRTTTGASWDAPVLVHASLYFRATKPDQAHVSVASDGLGRVLVAWDDPELGQSLYARSADNGQTWGPPQLASDSPSNRVARASVTIAPGGDFFLVWQDASAACGVKLRRSTDGGQIWSAAQRASTDLSYCPGRWQFSLADDGRLWLIGLPLSYGAQAPGTSQRQVSSNLATLVTWNGRAWSPSADVSLSFQDAASGKIVSLGNLDLALVNSGAGVVGTDGEGDVWAARNAVGLGDLISTSRSEWQVAQAVSDQANLTQVQGVPAFIADEQGKMYALWSESSNPAEPGAALYLAVWDGARWSRATRVFQSAASTTALSAGSPSGNLSEQPVLAIDSESRLHAVWRGGAEGEILYSSTFARDATSSQTWTEPMPLPMRGRPGGWPDIAVDPRSDTLHVIYAVPYNENRGIYYVRSNVGATTWATPTVVFDAVAAKWDSVDKPRLVLDVQTSVLHAVWLRAALIGEVRGRAVMYARSTDSGRTWSKPVKVAEGVLDWPRLAIARAGQVCLVWNQVKGKPGAASDLSEVWAQFSSDSGQRWTEPGRVPDFEDINGPVGLASDSAGGLYMVGVSQGASGQAALLYSRWDGQAWSKRELHGLGQDAASGNAAAAVLIPAAGRLGIALREFVRAPDGTGRFRLMMTGRDIQAVPIVKPVPTFTPLPTLAPTATPILIPTATARPSLSSTGVPRGMQRGPLPINTFLLGGGVLVALIILGVVVSRVVWAARR